MNTVTIAMQTFPARLPSASNHKSNDLCPLNRSDDVGRLLHIVFCWCLLWSSIHLSIYTDIHEYNMNTKIWNSFHLPCVTKTYNKKHETWAWHCRNWHAIWCLWKLFTSLEAFTFYSFLKTLNCGRFNVTFFTLTLSCQSQVSTK